MAKYLTENILGYLIDNCLSEQCIERICNWLNAKEKSKVLICANPHSLVVAKNDINFQEAIQEADLLTPDGVGIVIASKILGGTIQKRVTGSDIFGGLSASLNKVGGKSYFFLGANEETLTKIKSRMAQDFPNIVFSGSYSPPYKDKFNAEDSRKMVEAVNAARPDVLWVGMTAPKQEKWIYQNKNKLNVKFIGAIGAVFDFYAGNVKRSHSIFQEMGLEWLPRLMQEPRRLWRRNFISNPLFLLWVINARLKGERATTIQDKK